MEQEIDSPLRKEAIEHVPPLTKESGFYSRYFIVPKKDGGVVSDFRSAPAESLHQKRFSFKIITVKQIVTRNG